MAYFDIVNAMQLYGDVLKNPSYQKKTDEMLYTQPQNIYRGSSYLPEQEFKNIYLENPMPTNPFADIPETTNLMRGIRGVQYGGMGLQAGKGLEMGGWMSKGYGAKVGEAAWATKGGAAGMEAATAAAPAKASWWHNLTAGGKTVVPGLALSALAYGLTRDDNPYDYSSLEKMGGYATGAIAGGMTLAPLLAINPLLGVGIGLLGGHFLNKSGEKASARRLKKASAEYKEGVKEVQEERTEAWGEKQEELEKQQKMQSYLSEASLYDNQYGAYVNPEYQNPYAQQSRYTT
jgi:hypothetical protein